MRDIHAIVVGLPLAPEAWPGLGPLERLERAEDDGERLHNKLLGSAPWVTDPVYGQPRLSPLEFRGYAKVDLRSLRERTLPRDAEAETAIESLINTQPRPWR